MRHAAAGLVDRDERARRDRLQLVHQVVRPVGVDLALEVPVAAVVRHDQPVALHRGEDDLRLPAVPRHVEPRLQTEARAHRRTASVAAPRLVARRPEVALAGAGDREPDRVLDRAGVHLVPPHEPREDRQARRVGRRPRSRAGGRSRSHHPDGRSRRCPPSAGPRSSRRRRARRACMCPGRSSARAGRTRPRRGCRVRTGTDRRHSRRRSRSRRAPWDASRSTTSNGIPYAGGPKSGCSRVEPACIDFFQTAFFFAMGSFETSMFQTLSDGKTRHALPGTGALIGMRCGRGRLERGGGEHQRPRPRRRIGSSPSCPASSASRPWEVEPGSTCGSSLT